MSVHLEIAVQKLKKSLLNLAALAEEQVQDAMKSFHQRNETLARSVLARDAQVDQMEVDIEEDCLKILALYQPVAFDLRFVISVLKINNDLERIGDLAVNIAERSAALAHLPLPKDAMDYTEMAEKTMGMLKSCLDALISNDPEQARKVCASDNEIDEAHAGNYFKVEKLIQQHPEFTASLIQLMSISRYLERIADLATNIAEDVVYLAEGRILRRKERSRGNVQT